MQIVLLYINVNATECLICCLWWILKKSTKLYAKPSALPKTILHNFCLRKAKQKVLKKTMKFIMETAQHVVKYSGVQLSAQLLQNKNENKSLKYFVRKT